MAITLERTPEVVRCPDCKQRVLVVKVATVRSYNFHSNSGNVCSTSYEPVRDAVTP